MNNPTQTPEQIKLEQENKEKEMKATASVETTEAKTEETPPVAVAEAK